MDLAHYESMILEKHSMFTKPVYDKKFQEVGNFLRNAMAELIDIMEYFSKEQQFHGFPISL